MINIAFSSSNSRGNHHHLVGRGLSRIGIAFCVSILIDVLSIVVDIVSVVVIVGVGDQQVNYGEDGEHQRYDAEG